MARLMTTPILVVLPSIQERQQNLTAMVRQLEAQTLRPTKIALFLDGYCDAPDGCAPYVVWQSEERKGAGTRWRYVEKLSRDDFWRHGIVVALDDDFAVDPTYIQESVSSLMRTGAGMVTWTGHPSPRRYEDLRQTDKDQDLWAGGTGTSTQWIRHLHGITDHKWAASCFGPQGDEEALVSLWHWSADRQIIKPASRLLPIRHVHDLQFSETASHLLHGAEWAVRRLQMIQEYGWRSARVPSPTK